MPKSDSIVNKHADIHRIDLREVPRSLSLEEYQDALNEANADLDEMMEDTKQFLESGERQ